MDLAQVATAATDFEDCDWDEDACPVCNRPQDAHNQAQLTNCAVQAFDSRSTR